MFDISPPYLNLWAPADTAFLNNELILLQQLQHVSARLHHIFGPIYNFCYYFLVIIEVSVNKVHIP